MSKLKNFIFFHPCKEIYLYIYFASLTLHPIILVFTFYYFCVRIPQMSSHRFLHSVILLKKKITSVSSGVWCRIIQSTCYFVNPSKRPYFKGPALKLTFIFSPNQFHALSQKTILFGLTKRQVEKMNRHRKVYMNRVYRACTIKTLRTSK